MSFKVGVVIPTLNASHHLKRCLSPLIKSPLNPSLLVIDSSSSDDTVEVARELGARVEIIPQKNFNHGLTREMGRKLLDVDIVLMMTPDAYPEDETLVEKLVAPIIDGAADISYARQKPHQGASFFGAFPREFNYPNQGNIRGEEDREKYGALLYFCSDSCAAYRMEALDRIGGFSSVLLGEDTVATAKILQNGGKIAYVAEAIVYHSHDYSLVQEFKRYFDTGLARAEYEALIKSCGSDQNRGKALVKALFRKVVKEKPHLIPYAFLNSGAKWLGYQLGQKSKSAPNWWKRLFTLNRAYFRSTIS